MHVRSVRIPGTDDTTRPPAGKGLSMQPDFSSARDVAV